jgi:hypothetical protein
MRKWLLPIFSGLLIVIVAGYLTGQPPSQPPFPGFGDPAKARFYAAQLNPQSADGAFVLKLGSSEVVYLRPNQLLGPSEIADAIVGPDTSAGLYTVSIILSPGGVSALQQFVASNDSTAPIGLAWQNAAYSFLPAGQFSLSGETIVASHLTSADATALSTSLVTP